MCYFLACKAFLLLGLTKIRLILLWPQQRSELCVSLSCCIQWRSLGLAYVRSMLPANAMQIHHVYLAGSCTGIYLAFGTFDRWLAICLVVWVLSRTIYRWLHLCVVYQPSRSLLVRVVKKGLNFQKASRSTIVFSITVALYWNEVNLTLWWMCVCGAAAPQHLSHNK